MVVHWAGVWLCCLGGQGSMKAGWLSWSRTTVCFDVGCCVLGLSLVTSWPNCEDLHRHFLLLCAATKPRDGGGVPLGPSLDQ